MGPPLRREVGLVFLSRRHICRAVIQHEYTPLTQRPYGHHTHLVKLHTRHFSIQASPFFYYVLSILYDTYRIGNTAFNSSYIVACIHCSGNVFTEPLPSNGRLFWSTLVMGDTLTHRQEGDLINLLPFLKMREVAQRYCLIFNVTSGQS
jgi:hypothetical protein